MNSDDDGDNGDDDGNGSDDGDVGMVIMGWRLEW